ncbi:hypothetical protein Scep_003648 [Stephania cephalantha]|uniref:Protein kinase domain-containing protein n=1 Tax=Stephania cephalantha TaxID=152367 RepID=A0AAP0PWI7_9MAGN
MCLPSAVAALQDLYKALNCPAQLTRWNLSGGDPCEESWKGISCYASFVIFINLNGLELQGRLGDQLHNLFNLKQLDVSFNHLHDEIPPLLPPNATHIDLSSNNFNQSIPYSLATKKSLHYLNLSHNSLSGAVGNIFTDMHHLKQMDLSYNFLTGDLPSSFANLTNLTGLFLQNNKFSGSVTYLSNLPLTDLNIQNNNFSGVVPRQFQSVRNLWIGGNKFHPGASYLPWNFPSGTISNDRNTTSLSDTLTNVVDYNPLRKVGHKQRRFGPGEIACTVAGVALIAIGLAVIAAISINKYVGHKPERVQSNGTPKTSSSSDSNYAFRSEHTQVSPVVSSFMPLPTPPNAQMVFQSATENTNKRSSFSTRRIPVTAKKFTVAELQSVTRSFGEVNFLGEGSLGSVYKAQLPDGQILAVKYVHMVTLSLHEEDQFMEVIRNAARLRHPNIVTLIGFCMEHGQHLLVYEYVGHFSLDHALHGSEGRHLSWNARLKIALGIAQALHYLHTTCMPPMAHCNLKAANILLDDELMPRISDCGIAVLRPLTTNKVKLKAAELAISCSGYTGPENSQSGMDKVKSDIYAFGVLLLELLTGRRPFDSSRPHEEQSLVKWASCRLHDFDSLEQMVDPRTKRTLSSRSLSQFADIISLCIQPEPEFRPMVSEIMDSLLHLNQKNSVINSQINSFELSFNTSSLNSAIRNSPATSYASI